MKTNNDWVNLNDGVWYDSESVQDTAEQRGDNKNSKLEMLVNGKKRRRGHWYKG